MLFSTLCHPRDCSTPGFADLHHLSEFVQTHVHWVDDSIQPSHPLSSPSPLAIDLPSIRVFSSESVLHIRWSKYWSFSFSFSPSDEYSELISFRIDWFDFFAVQETLKILPQHHSPKAQEPWNPAISCLGVDLKNTNILKETCTPTITATLDTVAKTQKQSKCRWTDEWVKNMGYICMVKYYSAIKKDVILPLAATETKAEMIRLSEEERQGKTKYHMISLLGRIWKWIQMNFFSKEKQPHRFRKKKKKSNLWLPRKEVGGQGEISWLRLTYIHHCL